MIRRSTWVVLVIFAIVLAAAIFWQRAKKSAPVEATPTASSQLLFDQAGSEIQKVTIQNADGEMVVLERGLDNTWILTVPQTEATDKTTVETAISQLLSSRIVSTLSGDLPLADLGLKPPAYKIAVDFKDGQQSVLYVGKPTSISSGYYVFTGGGDRYVVSKSNLDAVLQLSITPPILVTPTPEVIDITPILTTTVVSP